MSLLKSVTHVTFTIEAGAAALTQAHQFYVRLLGLTELDRPADTDDGVPGWWVGLENGQQIHISAEEGANNFNAPSKRHAAFLVSDLNALRAQLAAADVLLEDTAQQPIGGRRFLARDPWGNRLEFIQLDA